MKEEERSQEELERYYNTNGSDFITLTPEEVKGISDKEILELIDKKRGKHSLGKS